MFCDATAQKITILIVVIIMFFFTTSFLPALSGSGRRRRAGSHGEPLDARASSSATDADASIGRQSGTPSSVSHVVDAASKPPPPPIAAKPRVKSTGEKPTWIQKTSLSTRAAAGTRVIFTTRVLVTLYFRLQMLQSLDELLEFMEIWGFAISFVHLPTWK